jgi:hypothetical protein
MHNWNILRKSDLSGIKIIMIKMIIHSGKQKMDISLASPLGIGLVVTLAIWPLDNLLLITYFSVGAHPFRNERFGWAYLRFINKNDRSHILSVGYKFKTRPSITKGVINNL